MWEPEFLEHVIILIKYKRKIGDLLKMGVLDKFLSIMKLDDGDDEYDDDEEDEIQKIADDKYILLGSTDLDDIAEETGLGISATAGVVSMLTSVAGLPEVESEEE